ncbi:MAG: phytoene desaturase [Gemmatimonadetes bacterium]|nr:phytoene desaturase [Gemmatimonadota bacterium]
MSGRAVVIGSGFGGLAAAVRLRARGYAVTVLEGMDQPGGRAAVFRRDGFTFDAGPTVLTAPYLLHELFALAGRDSRDYFTLVPVDPFYRIEYPDGSRFDYVGDEERLIEQVRAFNPADVDGYRRLAAHAERIFDVGYTQLSDIPFHRAASMLRVIPRMLRLESHRSVHALVSKHIRDERLRQAFSFEPLLVGGNPFRVTSIYLLIHWLERKWGVHFALGGTTSVVHALVKLLGEMDVEVRTSAPVERIETVGRTATGVVLESGERIPADLVVANADPTQVYGRLLPPSTRGPLRRAMLGTRRYSMGLFVGYFGTRRTYPELAHHTILMGPRYRGLLDDVFDRRVLADDFSLYLHAPTRTDPSSAPPGHECFYVLSPVPNNQSGIDWDAEGPRYFDRILDHLEARLLPGLRESLVTRFHVTPRYFEDTLRSTHGAGFGIEPRLSQSAYFRFHNRSPVVPNLYFVGSGTHPGAGVPGVLSSAKVLDHVVPDPPRPIALPRTPRAMEAGV